MVKYEIQLLNNLRQVVTKVLNPLPLNKNGDIIEFSKELSEFGQCRFRVSAFDPILITYGDILRPHQNHVRIVRNGTTVWQGAIVDNPKRTSQFIEIAAAEYEYYLSKILIDRSSLNPVTGESDGVFRIFKTGTMADAVTAVMTETMGILNDPTNAASPLAGMTLGTIENPNFPPNMGDNSGALLWGPWSFSDTLMLQYDFQTVLYLLKSFGVYAYADFYIDQNLVFNFKKFVGNDRHYDVNFVFDHTGVGAVSNIIDYNLPRLGRRMVNDLYGIATNAQGSVLHFDQTDQASISTNGVMQGVAAYSDVKDQGPLNARVAAELPLVATPDETNAIVVLNETAAYPLGVWDIGDIVNIKIVNRGVNFNQSRRIVGVSVSVHESGKEITTVQTNIPQSWQYGSSTS
jgi:hypothetical protein